MGCPIRAPATYGCIKEYFKTGVQRPNSSVLICTMEHVAKYHTQKRNNKSTFVEGLDVNQLIEEVLAHPLVKKQHVTKPKRWWYVGKFSKVIGHRGTDGAECRWLAVLVDTYHLITAYPIPHPKTLKFLR